MFLTKRPSGYYSLVYEESGKRKFVTTHTKNKAEAVKFLREFNIERHLREQRRKDVSLRDYLIEYLKHSATVHTAKTTRSAGDCLNELVRFLGNVPLSTIGIREVESFYGHKRLTVRPHTLKKYHVTLGAVFQNAVRWQYLSENPFSKVRRPSVPELLPKFFSPDQLAELVRAIKEDWLREIVFTAVLSGLRLGELLSLRWTQIDLMAGVIRVENTDEFTTKGKRARIVPLHDELARLLEAKGKTLEKFGRVFVMESGNPPRGEYVSKKFKSYVRQLWPGDPRNFHSLRHSTGSLLVQQGVSLYAVKEILGHRDAKTTQGYAHLTPSTLADSINKIRIK